MPMFSSLQSNKEKSIAKLFRGYEGASFSIRLWDGWQWASSATEKPTCTIVLETPKALRDLILSPDEMTLGEAFIHRELEIEGDIFSAFPIAEYLLSRPRGLRQEVTEGLLHALLHIRRWSKHGIRHTRARDRASISYHYDQPTQFFRPWLGESLAYSCAYFRQPDDPLDQAQKQKLGLICKKLRLQPSEQFLDIGCGWGSLILHAAGVFGVHASGITLSREQAEATKHRIERAGLGKNCTVDLLDYRELPHRQSRFDKIASVGMFEHVGLEKLPQYFRVVKDILRPGGVFLNHGIARAHHSPARKNSFIDRYVFPDGELVTLAQALDAAESQGFEVRDVENLREHYELTLRHWVDGLRRNITTLQNYVSDETLRIWLLYMAGSAAAFHRGDIAVYQVLLSRPRSGFAGLPLTREDWYSCSSTGVRLQ